MPDGTPVTIKPAKGRPMLTWVGKRPLHRVTAYPAQLVETFSPSPDDASAVRHQEKGPGDEANLLFHGDNKDVLAYLLANGYRGQVNLIYIDPPFDSGADYVRNVTLRGLTGATKLEGETYTLGEQIQYTDIWTNDNYLQFMYERLLLMKELLAENGSIVVHCDWNVVHLLRCVLDEVFMSQNFVNEVVWQHAVIGAGRGIYRRLPKAHETLLWYVKNSDYVFNTDEKEVRVPYKDRITQHLSQDENGAYYTRGRTGTDNPWSKDPRYLKTYVDIEKGKLVHDVWDDITTYRAQGDEYIGYPTQKPEELIARVVALSSNPGDLVLDCFIGSGTTAAVAQKLGRRWIGADINKGAIQTTAKRLQAIIQDQLAAGRQIELPAPDSQSAINNQQSAISFAVYRVNDYDLQIQHNEAVNLACDYLGITRTRTDAYFDGVRGHELVKIIPFNHPLGPVDLEDVKRELSARPDEARDVLIVALGQERSVEGWLADWNRLRHRGDFPNKLRAIELRTDAAYGKFFAHQPAQAKVGIKRAGDKIQIEITDFISPTIIERLQQHGGVVRPHIDDWRALVDSVMIDAAYDGAVFNITLADVPEKKSGRVAGRYELDAPAAATTVAVKITDMLGEEVIETQRV